MIKILNSLLAPDSKSRMALLVTPLIAAVFISVAPAAEVQVPLAYQLAIQPIALVNGKTCEIRGAVWAQGPRAGVNVDLTPAKGKSIKVKTNKAGIYTASLPYAGSTLEIREHIADPVYVPTALKDKARIHSPLIVCSKERTAAFLTAINRSAK